MTGTQGATSGLRRGDAWAGWSVETEEFIEAGESVVVFICMKTQRLSSGIDRA
jgi:hypothetical protein